MKMLKYLTAIIPVAFLLMFSIQETAYSHGNEKHEKEAKIDTGSAQADTDIIENKYNVSIDNKLDKLMDFVKYELPALLGIATLVSLTTTFLLGFLGHRRIIKFNLKWHKRFAYLTILLALSHGVWMIVLHYF